MILPDQTPLTDPRAGCPDQLITELSGLWVESVEEYLALLAAAADGAVTTALGTDVASQRQHRGQLGAMLAPESRNRIAERRAGGPLGCRVATEKLAAYEQHGRVNPPRVAAATAFTADGPRAARLMDRMRPVKNQGSRGTCVAFGTVALREFLHGATLDLSEQFLYWACKEVDGYPGGGTFVHTAMTALANRGVCKAATWPYNPTQIDGDEGQGPPPSGAMNDALQFVMQHTRTVEPSSVDHYREVLAGTGGAPAMPIVFATLVFDSWFYSAETHRTGKITMPLPGEAPSPGGHAWCVVGYQDERTAPGGGYFIVRNSWGPGWAVDCLEGAGHALMPYAYVERFALEAFSGEIAASTPGKPTQRGEVIAVAADPSDPLAAHLRVIREDTPRRGRYEGKDPDRGEELSPGVRILCDAIDPDLFFRDTPQNRERFVAQNRTWSAATRTRAWFPPLDNLDGELRATLHSARDVRARFMNTIADNLKLATKSLMPNLHLSSLTTTLPWQPRIAAVQDNVAPELSAALVDALAQNSGVPDGVDWSPEWRREMEAVNGVRVFRLRGSGSVVDVVSAFVTPIRFKAHAQPALSEVSTAVIEHVAETYRVWNGSADSHCTYYTLAALSPWAPGTRGSAGGAEWICLSTPDGDRWRFDAPGVPVNRKSVVRFLDRLKPETEAERDAKIESQLDDYFLDERGTKNVPKFTTWLQESAGLEHAVETVRASLHRIHESESEYGLRETEGEITIAKISGGDRGRAPRKRGTWKSHAWQVAGYVVGVTGWALCGALLREYGYVIGIIPGAICVQLGGKLQNAINERTGA